MNPIARRKRDLRRGTVARILALDPAARRVEEQLLAAYFPALPGVATARTVALYVSSFPEEANTSPMVAWSLAAGKSVVLPRTDRAGRRLRFYEVGDPARDLEPGPLGIPEPRTWCREVNPTEIDWLLVPGLAFDARGQRLGRGGGYYDRLLPTLRPQVPLWALILEAQWADEVPTEPHDVPVNGIASANRRIQRPAS